ncbi:hypothetical protein EDF50_2020 [Frigoribacterium sp. PhB24]|nr:hypothetical protein EDF50_2020 [Frigoribacterium sp. PhB24]
MEHVQAAGWPSKTYPPWAEAVDPWLSWSDPDVLMRAVELDRQTLRDVAPSMVINDCRIPMVIAALAEGIQFATICQDNQVPGYCYDGSTIPATWTLPVDAINKVLALLEIDPIADDARWLFARGTMAVPSTAELEPIVGPYVEELDIVHTGLLNKQASTSGSRAADLLFYRTAGSADEEFLAAFADWNGSIYIATGETMVGAAPGEPSRGRVQIGTLWDLDAIGPGLRAVVHHGGHGTTLRCIAEGIPAVVLPGPNPERTANGERAERLGRAIVMHADVNTGPVWGPAVDVTGDRPAWSDVRAALDHLPPRLHSPASQDAADQSSQQLVDLLTTPSSINPHSTFASI